MSHIPNLSMSGLLTCKLKEKRGRGQSADSVKERGKRKRGGGEQPVKSYSYLNTVYSREKKKGRLEALIS